MRSIEPGCLAIITHPTYFGDSCTVIRWVEPGDDLTATAGFPSQSEDAGWLVGDELTFAIFDPCNLRRIDGDEDRFRCEQDARVAERLLEVG